MESEKASKQATTISEVTGQSKTQGKKSFCLLKNPNTLILEVFSSPKQKLLISILPGIRNVRHPGKAGFIKIIQINDICIIFVFQNFDLFLRFPEFILIALAFERFPSPAPTQFFFYNPLQGFLR